MVYARRRRYRTFHKFHKKAYKKAYRRKYKRRFNKSRSFKSSFKRLGRVRKVITKMIARTNPMKTLYG